MQRREIPSSRNSPAPQRFANRVPMFGVKFLRKPDRINEPTNSSDTASHRRTNNLDNVRQLAIVSLSQLLSSFNNLFDSGQLRNSQRTVDVRKTVTESDLRVLMPVL